MSMLEILLGLNKSDAGKLPAFVVALVLAGSMTGCGAMSMQSKNGWATMGKTAGCETARLLCISLGGSPELCGAVGSGCGSIGGAVVHRYLPRSSPATSAEVGAEATRAMASSPLRSTFKVKRAPGFTIPKPAPGTSTDSKPLEIR
jgi:hypothetical protein